MKHAVSDAVQELKWRVEGMLTPFSIFAVALVILCATHSAVLLDPPYWDAVLGAFPQAHWLVEHHFSPWKLLTEAQPYTAGGACIYPFSFQPWIVALLEANVPTPERRFLVLHLLSFACSAFVVAWTYRLSRSRSDDGGEGHEGIGAGVAVLVAAALFCAPTFQALACQINMDMPLTACTLGALVALRERRLGACCWWSALALLAKPTGVITVGACFTALCLRWIWPGVFGPRERVRRALRTATIVHIGLLLLFVGEVLLAAHLGKSAPSIALLQGFGPLFAKRLWTLPEYGLGLVACLALLPWIVRRVARGERAALEVDLATFLVVFVVFFGQYVNVLPRYFLQSWPAVLVLLAALLLRAGLGTRVVGLLLALFAAFGLVNAHGRFHPTKLAEWSIPGDPRPLVADDGWLLERSMEYRDGLELDRELARRLSLREGQVVVTHWPLLHILLVPQFGYVEKALAVATPDVPLDFGEPGKMLALDAVPPERRVWALTPNVFCGESSRFLEGDVVLETVEKGRLRAFIVRRPVPR